MAKRKPAARVNGAPLTRDQLLAADDLQYDDYPVPEWGGSVRIKVMKHAEVVAWRRACAAAGEDKESELLICATLVDDDGKLLFTPADAAALAEKSGGVVERVAVRAMLVNRLYMGAVADSEKNSDPGRSANSSTA